MLSGSFDHTALVWPILDAIKVQHLTPGVLEGHSNSIWAVASVPTEPLSYLTGSADQLIKLFDYTNTAIKTFRGYSKFCYSLATWSFHFQIYKLKNIRSFGCRSATSGSFYCTFCFCFKWQHSAYLGYWNCYMLTSIPFQLWGIYLRVMPYHFSWIF